MRLIKRRTKSERVGQNFDPVVSRRRLLTYVAGTAIVLATGSILYNTSGKKIAFLEAIQESRSVSEDIEIRKKQELNIYPISSLDDLRSMSDICFPGIYNLKNDVDCKGEELKPIGFADSPFTEIFLGNGFTIHNFRITGEYTSYGLFGSIRGTLERATIIEGLNIQDFVVDGEKGLPKGLVVAGGLVGHNHFGIVANCKSKGSLRNSRCAGLLVGANLGKVVNCYSDGEVYGDEDIGTLIGYNHGLYLICSSDAVVNGKKGKLVGHQAGED